MSELHAGRRSRPAPRVLRIACAGILFVVLDVTSAGILAGVALGDPNHVSVGPGVAHADISRSGYRVQLDIEPNLGGHIVSTYRIRLTRAGRPVDASVSARFTMRAMAMPPLDMRLRAKGPGLYLGVGQKLTMPGRWTIAFHFVPARAPAFDVVVTDLAIVE